MLHIHIKPAVDCDVVVVGAGPAGSAAAYHLAHTGLKVILIDKHFFPRDKVCGDFVGPLAIIELQRLGITNLQEYKNSNIIRSAMLHFGGKSIISRSIPSIEGIPSHGRVIPRKILDQWLFDAAIGAGAQGLQGYRVKHLETRTEEVELVAASARREMHLCTKLIIGADGSNSTVAHQLMRESVHKHERIFSVRTYFDGVDGPEGQADLYFDTESFPGYYWLFPAGHHTANVGVGMVLDTLPPSGERLGELLKRLIKRDKALQYRLRRARMVGKIAGWLLPTYDHGRPIVGNRVMLVGDAAGLVNPLNGEGIQNALLSGRIAAEVATACIRQDLSKQGLDEYRRRIEREIRYDMALSNIIVQLIHNRTLNPIWLQILKAIVSRACIDPDYSDRVGGILAGTAPARDALSFKVIAGTMEQAAMSLAFESLFGALQSPDHLAKDAMTKGFTSITLVNEMLRRPIEVAGWGFGASSSAMELAGQAFKSVFEGHQRSRSNPSITV